MSKKFRCQYRLSDMLVTGASREAKKDQFNDADHGTTIKFDGDLPKAYTAIYNDTPGSEALVLVASPGAYLEVTPNVSDSDGDGIPDVPADGSTTAAVDIQKKDKDGNDLTGAGDNDAFFVELSSGAADDASGSLVNGAAIVVLQGSTDKGKVVTVRITPASPSLDGGSARVKYR